MSSLKPPTPTRYPGCAMGSMDDVDFFVNGDGVKQGEERGTGGRTG